MDLSDYRDCYYFYKYLSFFTDDCTENLKKVLDDVNSNKFVEEEKDSSCI